MSLRPPMTLTIGPQSFTIRPFTLKQIAALEAAVKQTESGSGIEQIQNIISVALSRDHSEKASGVMDFECDGVVELQTAMNEILRFTGFLQEAEKAPVAIGQIHDGLTI